MRIGQIKVIDQRNVQRQGLRSIVWTALSSLGGHGQVQLIYQQVAEHMRAKVAEQKGTDWRAIVRRILQETCTLLDRGVWTLPA